VGGHRLQGETDPPLAERAVRRPQP
jgi:hypothetical protein